MATTSTRAEVFYPESDGKPMAETTFHRDVMIELIVGLQDWFADDPLAYVSGNEFLYCVEGQPRSGSSRPTSGVVRGIDKTTLRPIYKTWQEGGKGPDFVVEMTSPLDPPRGPGQEVPDLPGRPEGPRILPVRPARRIPRARPCKATGWSRGNTARSSPRPAGSRARSWACTWRPTADLIRLFDPATGRRLLNRLETAREGARRPGDARTPRSGARRRDPPEGRDDPGRRTRRSRRRTRPSARPRRRTSGSAGRSKPSGPARTPKRK